MYERIKKYILEHKDLEEYKELTQSITGFKENAEEVELTINGNKYYVKISDLEKGLIFDPNTLSLREPNSNTQQLNDSQPVNNVIPEEQNIVNQNPAPQVQTPISNQTETTVNQKAVETETSSVTLNDVKTLVELKNKETLDNILKKVAVKSDNTVDINKIISIATNNLMNEAISSIMDNRYLTTELYKYDITGKLIVKDEPSSETVNSDTNINNSFSNLLIYIEAAKLYNINYTDEQIQIAKKTYVDSIKKNIPVKEEPKVNETNSEELNNNKTLKLEPTTQNVQKAGFVDVFILTVIVLVYAAIIVNLVIKLK